jgi:Cytochrome P450
VLGELTAPDRLFRPNGRGRLGPHVLSWPAIDELRSGGYTVVTWNCVPRDGEEPSDSWVGRAQAALETQDWTVLVLHDHHPRAVDHLPGFLDGVRDAGIEVTSELPDSCVLLRAAAAAGAGRLDGSAPARSLTLTRSRTHARSLRPALPGPDVDPDREQHDHAQRQLLIERIEAEQLKAVAHQGDEQHAADCPPDGALAAEDAGPADHDASQDGERERRLIGRLGGEHARDVDDSGQRRGPATEGKGGDPDQVDAHPERWRRLAHDNDLTQAVVEETLRRRGSSKGLFRSTTRDVEIGGTVIPKGAIVQLLYGSANHDPAQFPDPEAFTLDRPGIDRQVAFGRGTHFCLGAPLARLGTQVALQTLSHRFPKLEVPPLELSYVPALTTHTLAALTIATNEPAHR